MRRLVRTLVLTVLSSSALLSALLGACAQPAADGGFGEPKPVKDDGMIGRPTIVEQPVNWDTALAIAPAFDAASSTLTVTVQLKPGFHAYGPGEEVSKPVGLVVDGTHGWIVDGAVDIPAGQKKDLGELGTSVILEGSIPLKAKLKGGKGAVAGVVEVQVCTDKACDRPRKHHFTVPG
ncbi:MAG: hypothetical protein FJ137_15500 [Deltaproteobacteria bacterium]|nr:hypothetical protein [Deltaproteobacteria bacterium]